MAAVSIVAVDLAAIRAMLGSPAGELLIVGALPMANILAVGILVGLRRPGSHPALLGFLTFGAMALALYVALTFLFADRYGPADPYLTLLNSYLGLWGGPVVKHLGQTRLLLPVLCTGFVLMLGWPQVALGLIGGSLSRRYKITIARR
jgi:hypothetical protein